MRMMSCSRGGIHWSVALSASNDSSFATLNALNTSYICTIFNTSAATFNAISNDVFTIQYLMADATFNALSENVFTIFNT